MKIQFNPDLAYQKEAINAVCDLFQGQEHGKTLFTVERAPKRQGDLFEASGDSDLGYGNRLKLLPEDILKNLQGIQTRNIIRPNTDLPSLDFTIEMETGTGKTYVYLRTAFELNQRFGFTKFIVVVPSVAIKEGVKKSLQITEDHFKGLFDNARCDYFVYDSQKLGDVRNFATSDSIQIMVINIDAFRRSFKDPSKEDKANIIHRPQDQMTGRRPIEFIRATHPIVIIDEPQSVDTTPKSREAIESLNPLCTLRYSATHVDKHAQLYRLDAVDAYEQRLVKRIEVAPLTVQGGHNKAYIKLLKVENRKGAISAQIELDVAGKKGRVKRTKKKVRLGDDLFEVSGGREIYDGYTIGDIYCEKKKEYISFTTNDTCLNLGQAIGEVDDDAFKRVQIRRTIEVHLNKERHLNPLGIKVLSLFFIDKVANYRSYDENGLPVKGKYAQMFEEEYASLIKRPKYKHLFQGTKQSSDPEEVHNGYFAIDKKTDSSGNQRFKESRGDGKTSADESAYNLIMKEKEILLSLDTKLRFIFSHSALREGWDNPNVFQICTLNETRSTIKKRQEIGRGLRIAVDQEGARIHDPAVNILTVVANESYDDFARQLQQEIEEDTGIRFGIVEKHVFAHLPVVDDAGETSTLGMEHSENLWGHLLKVGYIDSKGRVQDKLKRDLKAGKLDLPEELPLSPQAVQTLLRKVAGRLEIANADDRTLIQLNKRVLLSADFTALWDRIKYKTTFRVGFDPDTLIQACADEIGKSVMIGKTRFMGTTSSLDITRGGVIAEEQDGASKSYVVDVKHTLPDIVTYLQDATNLTRRSVVEILRRSRKLSHFKRNPQRFIEEVLAVIEQKMQLALVDGIKYERIGDAHFYAQELFEAQELYGYLNDNMLSAKKAVYEHVVYDSDVEAQFAKEFEKSDDVKVYAKLPTWFKIDTPLGGYNPDWAVLVERDGEEKLYFVVETKGSLLTGDLRANEQAKIDCGREHFKALGTAVGFEKAHSYSTFLDVLDNQDAPVS